MAKVGRPPFLITPEVLEKVESLAARGLTQEQICHCLGICVDTMCEKKKAYPELAESIKKGQSKGISIVANALFEAAKSGDKIAQIFYLKARAHWKETNVLEGSLKITHEDALKELE